MKIKYNIPVDSGMGVYNGDMGIVKEINEYSQDIVVEFDEHRRVRYPFSELDEIELSYAITIHKSQGSEYPAVIIPILDPPMPLVYRNLLYTGVTRAKKLLIAVGDPRELEKMVENNKRTLRYTMLDDLLKRTEDFI